MPYIVKSSLDLGGQKLIYGTEKMQEKMKEKEEYIKKLEAENQLKDKQINELKKKSNK